MQTLPDIAALGDIGPPLDLAIGVFDGVHQGHAAVVGAAVGGRGVPVVVTFDPHPVRVLRPECAPPQITRMPHKACLLSELGVEFLLPVAFDQERAMQEADQFVREMASAADLASISVGEGFRFGTGRKGDLALLEVLGEALGFRARGLQPVQDSGGQVISSTRVRSALAAGELPAVGALLGRRYSIFGKVDEGRKLGRTIGFPTANISELPGALPPFGVYAVRALGCAGVANLGLRPTVDGDRTKPLLEVHLFDFDADIYGRAIDVEFGEFLRGEQTFDSIDALQEQIAKDVDAARSRA